MINIKNQIPSIYYDASRDFQILGHLYEVVLNYIKTNTDMLYLLPNGIEEDTRATELLATTLGFKLRRNYDKAQLAALVSIFPQLLKLKGTKKAIDLAGNALVKASGVPGEFSSEIKDHILTIKIPIELSDITLFVDLLPYILPFGIRVSIVRSTLLKYEAATPIYTSAVLQKATPGSEKFISHPLGLVNISSYDIDLVQAAQAAQVAKDAAQAAKNAAQAVVDAAQKAVDAAETVNEIDVAEAELDHAEAELVRAKAELDRAKAELDRANTVLTLENGGSYVDKTRKVSYSDSNFINSDGNAIAGQLGASPIIAFEPPKYSLDIQITDKAINKEENT